MLKCVTSVKCLVYLDNVPYNNFVVKKVISFEKNLTRVMSITCLAII